MFRLIVWLFVVSNGVMAEQPSGQLANKLQFETEKLCMEYLGSPQGEQARLVLEELVEAQKGQLAVKYACMPEGALRKEDNKI